MSEFTHLHVHTQYSILDGFADIGRIMEKSIATGMRSVAITDHGAMYGVISFVKEAQRNCIKPIVGCEVYVAARSHLDKKAKEDRSGFHLILLAKDYEGYKNLSRLVSTSYLDGHYYKPRVDIELLNKYHQGLIASTACLGGEVPRSIRQYNLMPSDMDFSNYQFDLSKAEEVIEKYYNIFKDDFYLELQRHGLPEQALVNEALMQLSRKNGIKCIATNDVHFINADDAEAHNLLVCLNTNSEEDSNEGMHYSGQEFLKTPEEMAELFADFPEAISNTQEISDKIQSYKLEKNVMLPVFPIPEGFDTQFQLLEKLTWEGAAERYPDMTDEIRDRIQFELNVVNETDFSGYFLIVSDFIREARSMGVRVGPGRGSAAGSVVVYCIGITNIDPIKYNLLFERFLNPERVSMPDMDIDFDDEGRERVIEYVINKYGQDKVAQIATFGTMAAKSAIRDVARVLKLPLSESDKLAKLVPEKPGTTLSSAFKEVPELLNASLKGDDLTRKTLHFAQKLEGSTRSVGKHACGIIIAAESLIDHVPLCTAKDTNMPVIQYEGTLVEYAGLLKMDFLGLRTLSIINDALENIHKRHGITIDIDKIPLDDAATYELFSRADTTGVFQFESDGMRAYLQDLKPDRFEDIIAMNALYRPGPMQYIPQFINRKFGREPIEYAYPEMKLYLEETYGITVYQEQVMLLSQQLGNFTKGQADSLRKAMGKKKKKEMDELKEKFFAGCEKNGFEKVKVDKIWSDWEAFAEYAFNKSHSTCYSFIAYQTAYLKVHYKAEFMAAVLTHKLNDIKEISMLIDDCRKQKIEVLGPSINESVMKFTVNPKGEILFGMGAIKGVGEAAVESIVLERNQNGPYKSIFDFILRVNLRNCNKRSLEAMAKGGVFDCFESTHRAQFFFSENNDEVTFIEKIIRYASNVQQKMNSNQQSLFGETTSEVLSDPPIPSCKPWTKLEQLKFEKEVTGFYISGHPLDDYKVEIDSFTNTGLGILSKDLKPLQNKEVCFAGIISSANHKSDKNGKPFCSIVIEDYHDNVQLTLFSEDYIKYKNYLDTGYYLMIKGKVQARWKSSDQFEVKISQMFLLQDVMNKFTQNICLFIPVVEINQQLTHKLKELMEKNTGKCPLHFLVLDANEQLNIDLNSKKYLVDPKNFITSLSALKNIKFKIN